MSIPFRFEQIKNRKDTELPHQFIVRMPPELRAALQERAVENRRSMNGQAIYEIEAAR
ncbi:Arc family DNA-binding protein (plasmid) [Novosphingobium aerophilum]|uniref:Arc family DNA-binding protein n=1 Tax=Novosphingobium aerophilum TaxID=2839843 RepID=UPI003FD0D2AA